MDNVHNEKGRLATASLLLLYVLRFYPSYGCVTVLASIATEVAEYSLPFTVALVTSAIFEADSITPSMCALASIDTAPATCQNTFWGSAPLIKLTLVLAA